MKKELLRFTLYAIIAYLTSSTLNPAVAVTQPSGGHETHVCGVIDDQWNKRYSDQFPNRRYARSFAANLNVGEPRTVRMIYFLPNDRPYRADIVQKMKDDILNIQTFFAEQMGVHGWGEKTFRVETDAQGAPKVHRMDGGHPDSHYLDNTERSLFDEVEEVFDLEANAYLIVIDNSINGIGLPDKPDVAGGIGSRRGKNGGFGIVPADFDLFDPEVAAHELGHAFGLLHDFRDGAYVMSYGPEQESYGPGQDRLSACHAEFLSVHPYFNPSTSTREGVPPTIKLISSPQYTAGAQRVPVRLKVSDSDGLHQAILFATSVVESPPDEVEACRGLAGNRDTIIEFDYDGVIPGAIRFDKFTSLSNPVVHPMSIKVVDTDGNVGRTHFVLFSEALEPLTKISGDNLQGFPNTPLPVPFVVELRGLNDGFPRYEVWVTFTVTAGGGTLSVERVKTDHEGRAKSTLTLGPNFGTNTVEVYAEGLRVIFNAVAGAPVDIPDPNLRTAIEDALDKAPGTPIAPAEMATLNRFEPRNANISDLTGLESATNLTKLNLNGNNISDISAVSGLTQLARLNLGGNLITDISAVAGLTHLTSLSLWGNSVSDISAVSGLTNLTELNVDINVISDISVVSGLINLTKLRLGYNAITDISALAGLTNLTELYLGHNAITDISAVAGLTNLRRLDLALNAITDISAVAGLTNLTELEVENNSILDISAVSGLINLTKLNLWRNSVSDISPLVENTGLAGGDEVDIRENPLNYASIHTHIPVLQSRGAAVEFDSRTATTLLKISGVITTLNNVLIVEVRDNNGRIFEGVPVTFTVISGGGTLSVTNTITDEKGRAQSRLTLGREPNRVTVSATGTEQTVTFSDVAEAGVHIPDPNLRAAIEDALGVKSGRPISAKEMATLRDLRARDASIGVLIGLEFATNLIELRLRDNRITDISPLSGLTNLRRLWLSNNGIKDLSALVRVRSGLTNLTALRLGNNNITDVSALSELPNLTNLHLSHNRIEDISSLSGLTHLTELRLRDNRIEDISSLSGLTHLTELRLRDNRITDISPLSGLTNLRDLELPSGGIQDLLALGRVLSGLTHLTSLSLSSNNIEDVSALIPVLSGLTDLRDLNLSGNGITDLSPLAILTNLSRIELWNNNISDISAVAKLTNLTELYLGNNSISDISAVVGLTNLSRIELWNNNVSDILPLVENTGLGVQDWSWVGVRENPLSYQSIHTHVPILQSRGVTVEFDNQAHPALLKISGDNQRHLPGETLAYPFVVEARYENGSPFAGVPVTFTVIEGGGVLDITSTMTDANGRAESTLTLGTNFGTNTVSVSAAGIEGLATFHAVADNPEFLWSIPAGISLIHVPLKVTSVDSVAKTIESIGDLYDALGGADTVNSLITYDSHTQGWFSYFGTSDKGTTADKRLTDDTGILANIKAPVSIRLSGASLGANGSSAITLNPGQNLVGLPLRDPRISHVSDLLMLEGIGGNVPAVILMDSGEFKAVGRADDPGDILIAGGQSFILNAQRAATIGISGEGWYNVSGTTAAPLMALTGIQVTDTTPVLGLKGSIVAPHLRSGASFRVIVKNLSTGKAVAAVTKDENYSRTDKRESAGVGYQVTIVDVETGRAAKIEDNLEISVRSLDPLIGVQPLRYTVTAEDVKRGLIQLTELVAYEIPTETELLHNYPNPFNPETWIPYRLAEDAFVTLTIYDQTGHVVRTLDVGHQIASAYETRSKAIYWDGRNEVGETVASGVYFYHLSAGDYSATRKMVILK